MIKKSTLFQVALMLFVTATFSLSAMAQTILKGKVVGTDSGDELVGASVSIKGTAIGTTSDVNGNFSIGNLTAGRKTVVISYIGFEKIEKVMNLTSGMNDLGIISLIEDNNLLGEIVVVGVTDIAVQRKTPVALSNIKPIDIEEKVGNLEFPEIMKSTPSVYVTRTGGGYGDSRINVRGFDQRNLAIMINGQPVNDMENGAVYWSNWQGLQDVANGIQIQRGLGATSIAVPSVGGTINIVTKATDKEAGGNVKLGVGNDGYQKISASYNTGISENGWATSILLAGWQGDGYVDGTMGQGVNYFLGIGYEASPKSKFNFAFMGAGQWHHQRSAWLSIRDYENFGTPGEISRKFNSDWGLLNGEEYSFRRNFYNKPIASIDWDWDINSNLSLTTVLYGSWGRGGGTGPRGRNFEIYPFRNDLTGANDPNNRGGLEYRTAEGLIDFDGVVRNNRSGAGYDGPISTFQGQTVGSNGFRNDGVNSNVAIRRASMNSHNWYGGISKLRYETGNWTLGAGIDLRSYVGYHYRVVNDLLGLDGYYSTGNRNSNGIIVAQGVKANPIGNTGLNDRQKINYYNIGVVGWQGFNGLAEYNNGRVSAVIQGGVSNQSFQRKDYFVFPENDTDSDVANQLGGYFKGGANFNIDEKNNIFFNAGFIQRQPIFDVVFQNFGNTVTDNLDNEDIRSMELGYGYTSKKFNANVNLYRTSWANRFVSSGVQVNGVDGVANFSGITQLHSGIEIETTYRPMDNLRLRGMISVGNWVYDGDIESTVFDDNQQQVGKSTLFVDGVQVGDAAQTTAFFSADYNITRGLSADIGWNYYGNLYADFAPEDTEFLSVDNKGAVKLPNYNLMDAGLTYRINFKESSKAVKFRLNVNNLFDTMYIAESNTNIHASDNVADNYEGVNKENFVWFGFGRTWNLSASFVF
jgi:outer membrane cobalamin receptor